MPPPSTGLGLQAPTFPSLETWGNQLRLVVSHATLRRQGVTLSRYQNRIGNNRLFWPWETGEQGGGEVNWVSRHGGVERRLPLRRGWMVLIPPDLDLDMRFAAGTTFFAVHFRCELIPGRDFFSGWPDCQECLVMDGMQARMESALADCESRVEALLAVRSLLWELVGEWLSPSVEQLQEEMQLYGRYRRMLELLDRRVSARTTVSELAAILGCSESSLSRRFHADFGETLKAHLTRRLLQAAMEALAWSREPVGAIVERLEFANLQYFSRFIRKHTGVSPRMYREQFLLGASAER